MNGHEIRLRAAWEGEFTGSGESDTRRVDLPTTWPTGPAGPAGPFRLRRRFQTPRIDPRRELLSLRLARVPGLVAARLNGQPLTLAPTSEGGADPLEVELPGSLPPRCLLELEVEPRGWPAGVGSWGEVALVIRPRGPAGGVGEGSPARL